MELKIEYLSPHDLTPYKGNARKHEREDLEQIKESIRVDGFNDPIGIWGAENLIVEGHGRQLAAIDLGLEKVPCIRLDHLTDAQRRDYAIRHNRTAELSSWDWDTLQSEIEDLSIEGFDLGDLFDMSDLDQDEPSGQNEKSVQMYDRYQVIIDCEDEDETQRIYDSLTSEGYVCRVSTL